jgi:hypothetical protein
MWILAGARMNAAAERRISAHFDIDLGKLIEEEWRGCLVHSDAPDPLSKMR